MVHRILCLAALSVSAMLMVAPAASAQGLNCDDFESQAAAQQRLREDPSDPDGLDGPPGEESFSGIEGVACEDLPPPTDFDPVVPLGVGDSSKGPLTKEGPPKGGVTKEGPPSEGLPERESSGEDKELLKAGGDLPPPQESAAPSETDGGGRFPLWRVAGMILSGGVFVFAAHRFFSRS